MTTPQRAHAQRAAKRHRLLADPTRLELVLALSKGPQTVASLASALGVHVNTVRAHLDRLQAEGMVSQEKGSPDGRGRPARRFSITDEAARQPEFPGRDYRLLSEVLLSLLRTKAGRNIADEAARSGEAWGRHLAGARAPRPGAEPVPEVAAGLIKEIFEQMQFAPELAETKRGWDVLLHNCPYKEVARENQDAVCSFHHGVLRGILQVLGSNMAAESLEPFVAPDMCRASLLHIPARKKRQRSPGS